MELSPRAERDLDRLPRDDAQRIARALADLGSDPRPRGVRKLKGTGAPLWRLRVGDHRVLYSISDKARLVVALAVRRRSEGTYDL
ncbi:MAG: type II toxin-antitoxin system RelE/ParE family toxin [Dehalococcoidia bacterium]